jgi:aldehyde dehydrogenase (NAD+)
MDVLVLHYSSTEELMSTAPSDAPEQAKASLLAARAAFPSWTALPMRQTACVDKIAHGLKKRMDELTLAISLQVGMQLKLARAVQVGGHQTLEQCRRGRAGIRFGKAGGQNSVVAGEAIGIVGGCITPCNSRSVRLL